jgi:hypothetical protein
MLLLLMLLLLMLLLLMLVVVVVVVVRMELVSAHVNQRNPIDGSSASHPSCGHTAVTLVVDQGFICGSRRRSRRRRCRRHMRPCCRSLRRSSALTLAILVYDLSLLLHAAK